MGFYDHEENVDDGSMTRIKTIVTEWTGWTTMDNVLINC